MTTEQRVVLVTGASRGAGKGIAIGLATDSVVYVTGRTGDDGVSSLPGTVGATAAEINARRGTGIAVVCDHADNDQVKALFERIEAEHGHLDILVNNATALSDQMPGSRGFWEIDLEPELRCLDVGLRSHYVAAYYAAQLMVPRRQGLIATISSPGATTHVPGVHTPTYGAGKAGTDKMVFDMGCELRPHNVAAISIWPGLISTERVQAGMAAMAAVGMRMDGDLFPGVESPEFLGRVIDAAWRDPQLIDKSGRTFYSAELAAEYGVTDLDGSSPPSCRDWLGAPST
ncbi:MAG TPA: SDR family NAD(P)-dependent oxidoreductase, partial [Ilumatobacteraceae bacterium]|nr:SDR family NAD(P)-dependent oxidoreductase [Ilumatobacteraceae bacterium]